MTKIENNIKLLRWYSFWENFILFYPVKVLFFAEVTGSFATAMSLFAVQNISSACFELPTGFLSDKKGRKWVCQAGALVMLISFSLYAFANSYYVLLIASVFNGLSWSLATGNNNALLYDSLAHLKRKNDYHKEISKNNSLAQLALGLASLFSTVFVFFSLRTVMLASIVPALLAFLITLRLAEPKGQKKPKENAVLHIWNSLKYIVKHKRLKFISLAETLLYGLNEAAFDFNAVFFKQYVPEWTLGIFRSTAHLVNSFANYLSFYVAKIMGLRLTVILGAYLETFINIISVLAANLFSPVIKIAATFFSGLKDSPLETLIQNDCSEKARATIISIISLSSSLFYSLCAVLIGILADVTSPYLAMLSAYILALLGNSIYFIALRQKQ